MSKNKISFYVFEFIKVRFYELLGFAQIILSIFIFISLIFYSPYAPSYNTASSPQIVGIFSQLRAYIADIILQTIGAAGFIICLVLFSWGIIQILNKSLNHFTKRLLFFIAALLALSFVLSQNSHFFMTEYPSGLGGFIGGLISSLVHQRLSLALTLISLLIVFISLLYSCLFNFTFSGYFKMLLGNISFDVNWRKLSPRKNVTEPTARVSRPPKKRNTDKQAKLPLDRDSYITPSLKLLSKQKSVLQEQDKEGLTANARMLETVLSEFGIKGSIRKINPGPTVILYEFRPAAGIKISRIVALSEDIARSMCAVSARVSAIKGTDSIAIELPSTNRQTVYLQELLSSADYNDSDIMLPLALGKDISGRAVIADLAKMPHLLIAGTTGSGKSVALNAMIMSLIFKLSPQKCRFILIDPKMLELSVYQGIGHLLVPVVVDHKESLTSLRWIVKEMTRRYKVMAHLGVRNLVGYNSLAKALRSRGEYFTWDIQTGFDKSSGKPIYERQNIEPDELPYIVVVVDEMADLMLSAGKEIELLIQRLSQMARAAGIHIIMATQRPSVDVITGTIKANFSTRISFQVSSKFDSRTILGEQGAEQLLGRGDMLYMTAGSKVIRLNGPLVDDKEIEQVVKHVKRNNPPPQYVDEVVREEAKDIKSGGDELYDKAVALIKKERRISTSFIQRRLQIGYNRAARIVEEMEERQVIGPADHVGRRQILLSTD